MKKLFSIICIITVLFLIGGCEKNESTNSIDLSSYSKDELVSLRDEIDDLLKEKTIDEVKSKSVSNKNNRVSSAEDFGYASNGSEIQINSYKGAGGDLVIPDTIENLPVTRIATKAFQDCGDTITSLTLPKNIKYIGSDAFHGLRNLSGVLILPDTLEEIDSHAFQSTSLTGIVIKSNCDIKLNSLANITSLEFIYVKENANPQIAKSTIAYSDALEVAILPESMTNIADDNFKGCNSMKIITTSGSYAEEYATRNFIISETDTYKQYISEYSALYDN